MANIAEIDALRPIARRNCHTTLSPIWRDEGGNYGWLTLSRHTHMPLQVRQGRKRIRQVTNLHWSGKFHPEEWYAVQIATRLQRAPTAPDDPDPHLAETAEKTLFWAIHPKGESDIFVLLTGTFENIREPTADSSSETYFAIPIDRVLLQELDENMLYELFETYPEWKTLTIDLLTASCE